MEHLTGNRIFEIAPIQCSYGRREFTGYTGDWLFEKVPFIKMAQGGDTREEAVSKLKETFLKFLEGAEGNIHWVHNIVVVDRQGADAGSPYQAVMTFAVHPYVPKVGV